MLLVSVLYLPRLAHAAENRSIWQKRQENIENKTSTLKPTQETLQNIINPLDIRVPEQYGTIIETHKGSSGKLIVHIQDAHANYEGQKSVANILESLINDYDLELVLKEGQTTDSNFRHLRTRASSMEVREWAAEKLLKEATIAGEDYLDITSDYDFTLQGVEDKTLYEENKTLFWKVEKVRDLARPYIEKLIVASDALKTHVYNDELLELDTKKKNYENENIDLLAYYDYMYKKAEEREIPMYVFPNFGNLIKANDIEKKIDLVKVRTGEASTEEMKLYNEYMELSNDLNINELFKEEPFLEETLRDDLAETTDQKALLKISKALSIVKNLLNVKAVPEEYKYFTDNRDGFNPQAWTNFLKGKSQELNLSLDIPNNFYIISDNLPKIEEFYGVAEERNKVFVRKAKHYVDKNNVQIAALIAGGFHTPRLTQLLDQEGFSYVVISPKVTTKTDDNLYRSTLKRD